MLELLRTTLAENHILTRVYQRWERLVSGFLTRCAEQFRDQEQIARVLREQEQIARVLREQERHNSVVREFNRLTAAIEIEEATDVRDFNELQIRELHEAIAELIDACNSLGYLRYAHF